jgi:heat shock protein HslJ
MKASLIMIFVGLMAVSLACSHKPAQSKSSGSTGGDRSAGAATRPGGTAAASPLIGKTWTLTMLEGAEVPPPAADRRQPSLSFGADGRIRGSTGVNTFSGTYTLDGQNLKFGNLAMSRMAGPPEAMTLEQKLVAALRATTAWRVNGGKLELLAGDRVVARFDPVPA